MHFSNLTYYLTKAPAERPVGKNTLHRQHLSSSGATCLYSPPWHHTIVTNTILFYLVKFNLMQQNFKYILELQRSDLGPIKCFIC